MKKVFCVLIVVFCVFMLSNVALSWDNEKTHRDLSLYASENSVLGTTNGDYLKSLGINKGLDEIFKWNNIELDVKKWLQKGAELEDAGSFTNAVIGLARFNNHFHNPLKPWSMAGLADLQSGESAITWAQNSARQSVSLEGDRSWKKTRDYFYAALTSKNDIERQANFAQTFRGLGHQMHLIQDMSVPAHVRNDAHPEDAMLGKNYLTGDLYFETWAKKNAALVNSNASTPLFPAVDLNISRNGFAPISQFIDTEQYNINISPSNSLTWGLSEYTNSNFVSNDTIFTENFNNSDRYYFPYPRYSSTSYEMFELNHSFITKRIYLKKKGDGEHIEHFATTGPLFKFLSFDPALQKKALKLDEITHYDYVSKLIPRAVGYSAGLLNYFFRGDMEAVKATKTKDSSGNTSGARLTIKNKTSNEKIGPGKFAISYQYKPAGSSDFVFGASNEVSISESIAPESESSSESSFIFNSPIPSDAKEIKYLLVYRGKLGKEEDAVAAKMIKIEGLRGGIIHAYDGYSISVVVLYENGTKKYLIPRLPNENIVKAAFDEGSVDVFRMLSMTRLADQRVWYITTFVYDKNTDKYMEKSRDEVDRINTTTLPNEIAFSYQNSNFFCGTCSYKGIVAEYHDNTFSISDFFVPWGQATKFLRQENNNIGLNQPFPKKVECDVTCTFQKWDYNTQTYKNCLQTGTYVEEYLDGSYENPNCRITAMWTYNDPVCGQNYSRNISGYCYSDEVWAVGISYFYWETCDRKASAISESVWIWLDSSLSYDFVSKKIVNPEYYGAPDTWTVGPNGPCLLFNANARYTKGTLSSRILSDSQVVVQSELRQGYYTDTYHETVDKGITIEPSGVALDKGPYLMLRQTGGYSMVEYLGNGAIRNHTSFSNVPSDKPVLLNKKGDGFNISFVSYSNIMYPKLQVGTKYNEKTRDFTDISPGGYPVKPESVMDIMVEYE